MPKAAPTLVTARLVLRPFDLADAADLFAIRGDPQAMRFWDWPHDETIDQTRAMARLLSAEAAAGDALYWTARTPADAFIGLFDLGSLGDDSAELGFMVARRHWGRGYATEAATALVGESRRRRLIRLTARIHTGNDASRNLLARLGFRALGADRPVVVAQARSVQCSFFALDLCSTTSCAAPC